MKAEMKVFRKITPILVAATIITSVQSAVAGPIEITEWMYKGANGEFVEFTNVSSSAVDMTNWSYSGTDRAPGDLNFGSVFGVVAPGESVILTETAAGTFRTAWGLSSSVKVFGSNTNSNLGRADEIHLYDSSNVEIDKLIFDDQTGKGFRTENKSGNIPLAFLSQQTASSAMPLSVVGDIYLSHTSTGSDVGNPGMYAPIPEPSSIVLALSALIGFVGLRRWFA